MHPVEVDLRDVPVSANARRRERFSVANDRQDPAPGRDNATSVDFRASVEYRRLRIDLGQTVDHLTGRVLAGVATRREDDATAVAGMNRE